VKLPKIPNFENPACAGWDTSVFYWFDHDSFEDNQTLQQIRLLCAGCPERIACAEHGIANEDNGIWGGLTVQERKKIRRKRARAKALEES